jgi:ribosomal protein L29
MTGIIESVISKAAAIYDLAKQVNNLELQQKIADLQSELIDMRFSYNTLRSENLTLQEKVQTLEAVIAGDLMFVETAYFHKESGEAFCPGCIDGDHTLAHLVPVMGASQTSYKCPRCKNVYRIH